MSLRNSALVLALAVIGFSSAQAGGAVTFVPGEIGWTDVGAQSTQSTVSRAQVLAELQAFRRNPVAADGARYVGGEMGYAYVPHTHEFRDGKWIALSGIGHNPAPPAIMTASERRAFAQQYPAR